MLGAGNQLPVVALDILHKLVGGECLMWEGYKTDRGNGWGRQKCKQLLHCVPASRLDLPTSVHASPLSPCTPPPQVIDDEVVVCKMNPVNEYLGPHVR